MKFALLSLVKTEIARHLAAVLLTTPDSVRKANIQTFSDETFFDWKIFLVVFSDILYADAE
jgi:hypothetical protein